MVRKFNWTQLPPKLVASLAFMLQVPLANTSALCGGTSVPPSLLSPNSRPTATSGTIATPTFSTEYAQSIADFPTTLWCEEGMDAMYQFTHHEPDIDERYSMPRFAGFLAAVGPDPFGVLGPTTIYHGGLEPGIGFNYTSGDEIMSGEATPRVVIDTNAPHLTIGFVPARDGSADGVFADAPSTVVPVSASLGLLGGGLLLVGGLIRKLNSGKKPGPKRR